MKKKYICHIGPGEDVIGGMSTVIKNITESSINKTYPFLWIKSASVSKKRRTFLKAFFIFLYMCIKKNVLCAHIHMSEKGSCYRTLIFILLCRIFKNKSIIHSHGSEFEDFYTGLGNGLQKKIFDYIFQKADLIIVLTKGWKLFWKKIVPENKIEILPNSVVMPDNVNKKRENGNILRVLFLGYLGQRKGTYDLIDAVKIARNKGIKIKVYLAGNGEIERCRAKIHSLNMEENIILCGWVKGKKKDKLLRSCDLLVLPSVHESFGIVLLEAMSYKMPVICSDGGYMKEVVSEGKDGFVIPVHNPKKIAECLLYFDKNRDKLINMGEYGYQKVILEYSTDRIMFRLKEIYNKVVL